MSPPKKKRCVSTFCLLIVIATSLTAINLFISVTTLNMAKFSVSSTTDWMNTIAGPSLTPKTKESDTTTTNNGNNIEPSANTKEEKGQRQLLPPLVQGLPKRLITIIGLENSGTVFMHMTLATALGLDKLNPEESINPDGSIVIQHTSLPAGARFDAQLEPMPILPINVLFPCRLPKPGGGRDGRDGGVSSAKSWPEEKCQRVFGNGGGGGGGDDTVDLRTVPPRHFVNITSHINWYRSQGVDATAVIVVRDAGIRIHGAFKYCHSDPVCYQQHLVGIGLIQEAIEADVSHVIVSYETLMSIQKAYLFQIYKLLNVNSTFLPQFKNGNMKYLLKDVPSKALRTELLNDVGPGVDMKL